MSALLVLRCLLALGEGLEARRAYDGVRLATHEGETLLVLGRELTAAGLLDCARDVLFRVSSERGEDPEVSEALAALAERRTERDTISDAEGWGKRFPERYEDVELVGRGGMALVFRAYDRALQRLVAIKLLSPVFKGDRTVLKRFTREVQAVESLDHPNIVKIFHVEMAELPYFSMEFLQGRDLRKAMGPRPRMPLERAAGLMSQLFDALAYAHEKGVVHRDVKPENLILEAGDRVKLVDFGLARLAMLTAITQEGDMLGTPWYMPPEQLRGEVADGRADVYAAGIVFYELLAGELPFPREAFGAQSLQDPEPLSRYLPEVPEAVEGFVMRCIARARDDRHATAREAHEALGEALAKAGLSSGARMIDTGTG